MQRRQCPEMESKYSIERFREGGGAATEQSGYSKWCTDQSYRALRRPKFPVWDRAGLLQTVWLGI